MNNYVHTDCNNLKLLHLLQLVVFCQSAIVLSIIYIPYIYMYISSIIYKYTVISSQKHNIFVK